MVLRSFCPPNGRVRSVTVYVSDFGKEAMADESRYGPRHIWKSSSSHDEVEDEDEDEDEDDCNHGNDSKNYDIYDKIQLNDGESSIEEEEGGGDDGDEGGHGKTHARKNENSRDLGDFYRPSDVQGVVLDAELKRRKGKVESDFDDLALKAYELRKLKYYFAIAECDSVATASHIYEQLDGMEFEHSSMVFDMRFVPDDVDFEGREKRDTSSNIPVKYEAPDFIINALQHTDVKCSWDENDDDREKKLTNLSSWRQFNDSDFQQYLASSDSDSDGGAVATTKKKVRDLLLGGITSEDDSENVEDDDDDFFIDDSNVIEKGENIENEKTFTFTPDDAYEDENNKANEHETPFEATLRKLAEKKKRRKHAKKELKQNAASQINNNNNREAENEEQLMNSNATLQLMFSDQEDNGAINDDYDMRQIAKFEKDQRSGKKIKKRFKKNSNKYGDQPAGLDFKVDVTDERFSDVFDGSNQHFGIDRTATEFKETENMKEILSVQRKKRAQKKEGKKTKSENLAADDHMGTAKLVSKLKRKFGARQ